MTAGEDGIPTPLCPFLLPFSSSPLLPPLRKLQRGRGILASPVDVPVGEEEQVAVEVGVEPVRAESDEAEELLAEEGPGGDVRLLHAAALELRGHGAVGLPAAGEDQDARGVAVEALVAYCQGRPR